MIQFGDPRLPERFWAKVQPCPMSGCWLWTGATMPNGYGVFGGGTRASKWTALSHRHAFVTLVGEIPVGLELDHLCRTRCCCNPAHLEPVTRAVNMARSPLTPHARKNVMTCKRGHLFSDTNSRKRQRACRYCEKVRRQERMLVAAYHADGGWDNILEFDVTD